MSVLDQIIKFQGVLAEAKPVSCQDQAEGEDGFLAGKFGYRAAGFGARKALDGTREIFYKIAIRPVAELPPALQLDCPVIFPEGSEFANADVRILENHWLTEKVPAEQSPEEHFSAQTEASIRDRLTALSRLASGIDNGAFSLKPTIAAHVKKNIRTLSWMMAGGFVMLVLAVVAVSMPFFYKPLKVSELQEGSSRNATLRSTRIARAQAERAMNENSIMPPGSSVFLMVTPDRTTVPLGEKVTLLYEVLTRYSTKCWGFYNEGKFRNFRVERKDAPADSPRVVVLEGGRKLLKFAVGTASLTPQQAGEQKIYPGTAFVSARAESGQILDVYLTTKPMTISVVKETAKRPE